MRLRRLLGIVTALAACSAVPAFARASTDSGFEVELGRFKVRVVYVDVLDYSDHAERAIRDPRRALFAVTTLLQANARAFASIAANVRVEIDQQGDDPGTRLWVSYSDPQTGALVELHDGRASPNVERDIVRAICRGFPNACVAKAGRVLDLYVCRRDHACPGQILFGVFPSDTMNKAFGILAPRGTKVKRLRVSRADMPRHFEQWVE